MNRDQKKDRQKLLMAFLFYVLLFMYPLLALLWRRSYPVFSGEVGTLLLLIVITAILITAILSNVRSVISSVFTSLLITTTFLVQFNLMLEGLVICLVISLIAAWWLRANFHLYSLPVVAALILGAWFDSKEGNVSVEAASVNSELPPVVHILLDGFIGLDGLPPFTSSAIIRDESHKFFKDFDFQVFPRAYSRYSATVDSLNSAFNFQNSNESRYTLETLGRQKHVLRSNAQFDLLEALGYRFNIYQTGHFDLCQSNRGSIEQCWEYAQPNINSVRHVESTLLKSRMLASVLLNQSYILSGVLSSHAWLFAHGIAVHDPRVFSKLGQDILNNPNGRYFFAHVLLPHPPFTYLHDCSINYESEYLLRVSMVKDEPEQNERLSEFRTNLYYEQMDCALISLRQIFEDMQKVGIFERSIIVVHGDHGSMIAKYLPRPWNLEHLTSEQYRAHYSTLFAFKFPHSEFQLHEQSLPLSALMEGFSKSVQKYVAGEKSAATFSAALPVDPEKVEPYIYLLGSAPMKRININIFED